MRIHRLTIEAFGPFGGRQVVDFDALGAHGLFLMHGPTGSGKTSVLDAVCFALFGQVPGARRTHVDRLRSDHAAPHLGPRVEMEFTVAGRRLRVARRPAHLAPKKRGSGTTRRQASVTLEEHLGGGWRPVSNRLDETGEVLADLLGLGLEQFAQVVLLPQGEFAAFLRAKADDRAALLERLFDISRFADVEQWLADHRRGVRQKVTDADARVRTSVVRAEESLADHAEQIERWRTLPLDELPAELDRAAAQLSTALTTAMAADDAARAHTAIVREAHDRAVTRRRLAAELTAAQQTWQHHLDTADERAATQARLERHDAAQRGWPLIGVVDAATADLDRRSERAAELGTQLRALLGMVTDGDDGAGLGPALARVDAGDRAVAGVRGLLDLRDDHRRRLPEVTDQQRVAAAAADAAQQQLDELTERENALTTRRGDLTRIVAPEATVRERLRLLQTLRQVEKRLRELRAREAAEIDERDRRMAQFTDAEQAVLELRRGRLTGMAAELAIELKDDDPCPVCGSLEHPLPAVPANAVTADEIAAAEKVASTTHESVIRARTALAATTALISEADLEHERVRTAWAESATAEPPADASLEAPIEDLLARQTAAVRAITTARTELAEIDTQLTELNDRRTSVTEKQRTARHTGERAAQTLSDLQDALATTDQRLESAVSDHAERCGCSSETNTAGDPADMLRAHLATRSLATAGERAADAVDTAREARDSAAERLQAQLDLEGFADRSALVDARLDADVADRLRQEVTRAERAAEHARGVLDRPDIREVAAAATADPSAEQPDDVEALAEQVREAQRAERAAHAGYESARRAQRSIERLATDVAAVVTESAADRERLPVADRMADLVNGGSDNALRMRLSSYVLAARLEQVTELANETLSVMTAGRYRLQHTDERAKGGSRSGLGLEVVDAWTGTTRDTASLSGGESFMASLALALGLGQAVLHDAGGRPLQTLLVDEGFGSLDDESLELVMQVLDELRAGGRTVGIVSHVGELRTRVPAQIEVHKSEQGSSLQVHLGDASPAA